MKFTKKINKNGDMKKRIVWKTVRSRSLANSNMAKLIITFVKDADRLLYQKLKSTIYDQ